MLCGTEKIRRLKTPTPSSPNPSPALHVHLLRRSGLGSGSVIDGMPTVRMPCTCSGIAHAVRTKCQIAGQGLDLGFPGACDRPKLYGNGLDLSRIKPSRYSDPNYGFISQISFSPQRAGSPRTGTHRRPESGNDSCTRFRRVPKRRILLSGLC